MYISVFMMLLCHLGPGPLLSDSVLVSLNDINQTIDYFGSHSLASNNTHRTRVVYFILDGMKYEELAINPTLHR